MQTFLVSFSSLLTFMFLLYGINHYYLLYYASKYHTPPLPETTDDDPTVSIHLPIYNECYVVGRLIHACAAMAEAYGKESVNIKILDDSTDDTSPEIDQLTAQYQAQGINIEVLRRPNRNGFKAGALQAALAKTKEDFIAVFDADFIPSADFLLRTMPYFSGDEHVGIVQSRWSHLNRDYNLLTRAIAIGIDVHFFVEQPGRYQAGLFQNFNGSGGVLRKSAIIAAGGWQSDTLAEDLDLSYRMQTLGYKVLYLKDLPTPGEVPPSIPGYKKQQGRWANGSLRTARKLLPIIRNPNLSFKIRLEALIHLTSYFLQPLMLLSFLLACSATLLRANDVASANLPQALTFGIGPFNLAGARNFGLIAGVASFLIIGFSSLAPTVSVLVSMKEQNLPILKNLGTLLITFFLGFGNSLSNSIEAGKGLLTRRRWDFIRTPKYADLHQGQQIRQKKYQVPLDSTWALELGMTLLGAASVRAAILSNNFGALGILIPYTAAYLFVFLLTLFQSRRES